MSDFSDEKENYLTNCLHNDQCQLFILQKIFKSEIDLTINLQIQNKNSITHSQKQHTFLVMNKLHLGKKKHRNGTILYEIVTNEFQDFDGVEISVVMKKIFYIH